MLLWLPPDIIDVILNYIYEMTEREFTKYITDIYSIKYSCKRMKSIIPGYVKIFLMWTKNNDNIFQIRNKYRVRCTTIGCDRLVNPRFKMRCPMCELSSNRNDIGFLIIFF